MYRLALFLVLLLAGVQAGAQSFPSKPVKIVVGYPPGGSGDFLTRIAADEMSKSLGVAVIAENKPGAGGNIAAELVARASASPEAFEADIRAEAPILERLVRDSGARVE